MRRGQRCRLADVPALAGLCALHPVLHGRRAIKTSLLVTMSTFRFRSAVMGIYTCGVEYSMYGTNGQYARH